VAGAPFGSYSALSTVFASRNKSAVKICTQYFSFTVDLPNKDWICRTKIGNGCSRSVSSELLMAAVAVAPDHICL
jgi:hypothetical protein